LLKYGSCYLPDYALTYLDIDAKEFSYLYDNESEVAVMRQNSSILRKKSLSRGHSLGSKNDEENKVAAPLKLVGKGKVFT